MLETLTEVLARNDLTGTENSNGKGFPEEYGNYKFLKYEKIRMDYLFDIKTKS